MKNMNTRTLTRVALLVAIELVMKSWWVWAVCLWARCT